MIDLVQVGRKLSTLRKEHHLTQEDVAQKLYITRQLVSKWENGTGAPSIDDLLKLCQIYNSTFEDLLCLEEEMEIDQEDLFKDHERLYVVESIISGKLKVSIPEIFYQLSPAERMLVLRNIKAGKLQTEMEELLPRLTPSEIKYLQREEIRI